jgi:hypothetical protein
MPEAPGKENKSPHTNTFPPPPLLVDESKPMSNEMPLLLKRTDFKVGGGGWTCNSNMVSKACLPYTIAYSSADVPEMDNDRAQIPASLDTNPMEWSREGALADSTREGTKNGLTKMLLLTAEVKEVGVKIQERWIVTSVDGA